MTDYNWRKDFWLYLLGAALAILGVVIFTKYAKAVECPRETPVCKVIYLTPDEEKLLLAAPGGILDTAERARFLDLTNYVKYFRDKIATAPLGDKPQEEQKVGDAGKLGAEAGKALGKANE